MNKLNITWADVLDVYSVDTSCNIYGANRKAFHMNYRYFSFNDRIYFANCYFNEFPPFTGVVVNPKDRSELINDPHPPEIKG